ncbi:MAG: glycosyltransferase [Clostridiales bacterium]|nr:glycosyltransferase [Clostridiales bacterium]
MTILIPSYEPDIRLIDLVNSIHEICSFRIVIVDDGSGSRYKDMFNTAVARGCIVLTHSKNKGKGRALKTGFEYLLQNGETEGVVCADSDGQHLPQDILRLASKINEYKGHIILGSRKFTGSVPFRSRFGNSVTRSVFSFSTGTRIYDTQTGLRGFSCDMLEWLCKIPGERFEYEMNMLLDAKRDGYSFHEIDIETVYHQENTSSHFRTIRDSARVYLPIFKFSASSLLSALIDFMILLIVQYFTSNLLFSAITARVCSSFSNFLMNKTFVFDRGRNSDIKSSLIKYYSLAIFAFAINYCFLYLLNVKAGLPLVPAKIIVEAGIFIMNYWIQRKFVFMRKTRLSVST